MHNLMQYGLQLLVHPIVKQSFIVCFVNICVFLYFYIAIISIAHISVVVQSGCRRVDIDLLVQGIYGGLSTMDAEGAHAQWVVQALQVAAF